MGLPWVRLDSNIGSHDKILALLEDPAPKAIKWQAVASYVFAVAWSGGQETDGRVTRQALPFVHGSTATARLLVSYRLWEECPPNAWQIVNFSDRQQVKVVSDAKRAAQSQGAAKGNCGRWHEPGCTCTGVVVKTK